MNRKLKSPQKLFEDKQLQFIEELEYQKKVQEDLEIQKELSGKLISPKIFFGTDEFISEEILNSEIEKERNILEESEIENIEEEIDVKSILINLSDDVNSLKKTVENTKKYSKEIKFLKKYVKTLEDEISSNESFNPSDLYENIKLLKRDVEKVKSEIPEVPDPILYDEQLENLKEIIFNVKESIPIVPEIKYYDNDLTELLESVEKVRSQVEEFPEVKYYDYQITSIEEKISEIRESIPQIPEIKYYDEDIVYLQEKINDVKSSIPTVPEVKYYDEEISSIENKIKELKTVINNLPVLPEVKYYDDDIERLLIDLSEVKLTIKELPEPKYYEKEFELFDQKIESIKKLIPESQVIPEIKYYDNEILQLKEDIAGLSEKISSIKIPDSKKYTDKLDSFYREFNEKNSVLNEKVKCLEEIFEYLNESQEQDLEESVIVEPPEVNNGDPLTPLTQKFVTFKDLQDHYRTFVNRIQQQLATIGGGGETRLEFLDDVDRNSAKTNGYVLQYDSSVGKFIGTSYVSGSGGDSYWSEVNAGIYTTGNVAIGTDVVSTGSTALWVQGDSQVVGKLTVSDLYFDGSAYTEINAGISTLNITSSTITIGSTLQPSLDSVYDLGSLDRQWKELYLSGATLYLAGVPISLTSNVNNQTTIAVDGTSLVRQPDLQAVDDQVQFLTTGVANVGFYDADLGVISTLTEIGTKTGIYTQGQSLSNVGIVTGHYFIVSKGGNNIGVGNTFIQSGIASAYIGDWIAGISTTQWGVLSYSSSNIVPLSNNSLNLGGQLPNYYLNYNNFVNTPTNLSDFSNDVGFLTTGGSASSLLNLTGASQGTYGNSTVVPQIEVDNTGRITSITQVEITGGSGGGGGSTIKVGDNNNVVGTASTLNFGQDLDVTLTGEVATINVSIPLSGLTDVNTSNLSGITTDYLMVYDPSVPEFKFVDPKTYFGINNDSNPDPTIDDFGSY